MSSRPYTQDEWWRHTDDLYYFIFSLHGFNICGERSPSWVQICVYCGAYSVRHSLNYVSVSLNILNASEGSEFTLQTEALPANSRPCKEWIETWFIQLTVATGFFSRIKGNISTTLSICYIWHLSMTASLALCIIWIGMSTAHVRWTWFGNDITTTTQLCCCVNNFSCEWKDKEIF